MEDVIRVCVKGFILHEGKVLIIQRSGYDNHRAGTWECPGGGMEFGESLTEAMKREAREEAGIEVDVKEVLFTSDYMVHEHKQAVILTYFCEAITADVKLSHEHTDFIWADAKELKEFMLPPIYEEFLQKGVLARFGLEKP